MKALELAALAIVVLYLFVRARREERPGRFVLRMAVLAAAGVVTEDTVIRAYGFYAYAPSWSVFLDQVPLMIGVIWPVVIYSAWDIARGLAKDASTSRVALIAASVVLADASLIEPIAVKAGLWRWTHPGPFEVPIIGILGWALFAFGAVLVLESSRRARRDREPLLVLLPLPLTHVLLLASWWGGLRSITTAVPSLYVAIAAWVVSIALTAVTLRARPRVALPMLLVRVPAALYFFVLLAVFARDDLALVAYALAFAGPYVALTFLAEREPRAIAALARKGA